MPGLARRRDQRLAHLVRVVVGHAARAVVQVVELADRGDPGERHLGEGRARQREVAVGVEPVGELVHRARARSRTSRRRAAVAAAQRAVEGVRVGVGEPGQRQPVEPRRAAGGGATPASTAAMPLARRPRPATPASARSPPSQASSHQ